MCTVSRAVVVALSVRFSCARLVRGVGLCDVDGVLLDGALLAESDGCNSPSRRVENRREFIPRREKRAAALLPQDRLLCVQFLKRKYLVENFLSIECILIRKILRGTLHQYLVVEIG